jgi:hypothetical protein
LCIIPLEINVVKWYNYKCSKDDKDTSTGKHLINVAASGMKLSTISQITATDTAVPVIEGMTLEE